MEMPRIDGRGQGQGRKERVKEGREDGRGEKEGSETKGTGQREGNGLSRKKWTGAREESN